MKHIIKFTEDNIESRVAKSFFRAVIEDALTDAIEKLETDEEAANNFSDLIDNVRDNKKLNLDLLGFKLKQKRLHCSGEPFAYAAEMVKLLLIDIKANYNKVDATWTDRANYNEILSCTTHPMNSTANEWLHEMKTYIIENSDDSIS